MTVMLERDSYPRPTIIRRGRNGGRGYTRRVHGCGQGHNYSGTNSSSKKGICTHIGKNVFDYGHKAVADQILLLFSTGLRVPKACAYQGGCVPYPTQRPKKHYTLSLFCYVYYASSFVVPPQ